MNRETDDMNSLDSVALNAEQMVLIGQAMEDYNAPEMYWDESSDRDAEYRKDCAAEIHARIERRIMESGFSGSAVAFSEEEYRVTIEALVQYKRLSSSERSSRVPQLISHLQWFKAEQ